MSKEMLSCIGSDPILKPLQEPDAANAATLSALALHQSGSPVLSGATATTKPACGVRESPVNFAPKFDGSVRANRHVIGDDEDRSQRGFNTCGIAEKQPANDASTE